MDEEKLIHRDDMDMEEVAAVEQHFADLFPGMKVVFAGDSPDELPPELAEQMRAIEERHSQSLVNGTCVDCGAQMPNYEPDKDGWEVAPKWSWFTDQATGDVAMWQCPECDAKDKG